MFSRSTLAKAILFGVPMAACVSVISRARLDAVDVDHPIFQIVMHTITVVAIVLGIVFGPLLLWAAMSDLVVTIENDKHRSSFRSVAAFYYSYRFYPVAIAFAMFMLCSCGSLLRAMLAS